MATRTAFQLLPRVIQPLRPRSPPVQPHQHPIPSRRQPLSLLSALANLPGSPSSPSSPPPRTIRAHRTLPHPPSRIYDLIADVDAYSAFLPYCTASRVTRWTRPSPTSDGGGDERRWPARADLTVGWGPFTESYTSRLYCVPESVIEAVSGPGGRPTLDAETLARLGLDAVPAGADMEGGIFESLVTRWEVGPAKEVEGWTDAELAVRFRFANPALGLAACRIVDEKVEEMIQAFEDRARELYGQR
ncbi:hypothetical protein P8C59_006911 [Phyllachora maydis]|uniref:Coenzyme Q-binding protein COQ10 START domain-containing protein n=1 Tax=Phyllachora maydis TaxID=1825666 RepID=A0AAD9I8H2_9PEZI|nr:hypothetical protein P8C59_006911 [Phyllachora maydis]